MKQNKCSICNRKLSNHSGVIFTEEGRNEIMHPIGYSMIVCLECYLSHTAQYIADSDYIIKWSIETW